MGKAEALSLATGQPVTAVAPGLITQTMPTETQAAAPAATPTEAEAAAAVAKPNPTTAELQSSRLAIFAKKEAQIQKEREELKREREALLKEKAEADMYRTKGREFDELAKKDKIAALKLIGWSESDIVNAMAAVEEGEKDPGEIARKAAQEESQKLRDELKQKEDELNQRRSQETLSKLKSNIETSIKKAVDKFEYCSFEGAEAIEQAYENFRQIVIDSKGQDVPTIEEVLEDLEAYYEAKDKAMSSLKKRQPKPAEAPATAAPSPAPAAPAKEATATAAESTGARPSPTREAPPVTAPRRESPQEKRERLAREFLEGKFEKKSA